MYDLQVTAIRNMDRCTNDSIHCRTYLYTFEGAPGSFGKSVDFGAVSLCEYHVESKCTNHF